MNNKKGQALIEFIIIIPILILIIACIIDFGNIIYEKYKLQNDLDTVIDLYKNNNDINSYLSNKNIELSIKKDSDYTTITLNKDIDINTIILNNIMGKKYLISVNRTIIDGDSHE